MNKEKKSKHIVFWAALFVFILFCIIVFNQQLKDGLSLETNSDKGKKEYDSIDALISSSNIELSIPQYIIDEGSKEKLNINELAGKVVTISSNNFAFKASDFLDVNADILGLLEDSSTDNKYNVRNNDINYVRYRRGYTEYPNCTIINWCTEKTTYGLMIEEKLNEEEMLEIIGINIDDIEPITNNTDDDTQEYKVSDTISIKLPKFNSEVTTENFDGCTVFSFDGQVIFIVVYDNDFYDNELYSGQSEIIVNDNIKIYYISNNPFDINSDSFNDYNTFISTIESIKQSIIDSLN